MTQHSLTRNLDKPSCPILDDAISRGTRILSFLESEGCLPQTQGLGILTSTCRRLLRTHVSRGCPIQSLLEWRDIPFMETLPRSPTTWYCTQAHVSHAAEITNLSGRASQLLKRAEPEAEDAYAFLPGALNTRKPI